MNIDSIRKFRLIHHIEYANREKLEDVFYWCYSENPIDQLTDEDIRMNIVSHLDKASTDELSKIFKLVFK